MVPLILMYHSVARRREDPHAVCVSPLRLDQQMTWLRRRGMRGVTVAALLRAWDADAADGLVGLTFDDGYQDFVESALPILERHAFTATVFPVAGLLGQSNLWDEGLRWPLLTKDALQEAAARGVEIGCHGLSHRRLSKLSGSELDREVRVSKEMLEEVTGTPVEGFCYPYGDAGSIDQAAIRAVRQAGYRYACAYRLPATIWSRFTLPRVYVGERDGPLRITAKRWRQGLQVKVPRLRS